MTLTSAPSPGHHVAQLYEGREFLQGAVASFFSEAASDGGPMIAVCRPETFDGVCERFARVSECTRAEAAARLTFLDVNTVLRGFMVGGMPDPVRFEQLVSAVLTGVRQAAPRGTIRLFGETTDVLCAEGHDAGAIRVEELWNTHFGASGVSVLCGYAIGRFDDDEQGSQLRAVCRTHTLVVPTEKFEPIAERARFEHIVLQQQRARQIANQSGAAGRAAVTTGVICLIEDDASVRRSLSRLIGSIGLRVNAYPSAEAFLSSIDQGPIGCIVADVQLTGMSGLELQSRLQGTGWPLILISGSYDRQVESEALRHGARAFLRKPFQAQQLFAAIRRALA